MSGTHQALDSKHVARGTCHDCHDTPKLQVIENDDHVFVVGPGRFYSFFVSVF